MRRLPVSHSKSLLSTVFNYRSFPSVSASLFRSSSSLFRPGRPCPTPRMTTLNARLDLVAAFLYSPLYSTKELLRPPRSSAALVTVSSMDTPTQTTAVLFQRQTTSKSSLHDAEETSQSSSPYGTSDLEKAETADDEPNATTTGAYRATSSGRILRIKSL